MTLNRANREQLFKKITTLVKDKFYDPKFKGKDWSAIAAAHRQRILEASTNEIFETATRDMLGELGSSALGLINGYLKVAPRNSINASFRSVQTKVYGERWVFQDVFLGGAAANAGARPGDVLISLDGEEIAPTEQLAFKMGTATSISVRRDAEPGPLDLRLATSTPKYQDNPYTEPQSIQTSILPDGIGLLKVTLFPGKIGIDFARKLSESFASKLNGVDRLIIDLRGNPGGGIGGLRLMSHLTPQKQPIGYSLDRQTAEGGYDKAKLPRLNGIPHSKAALPLLALKLGTKRSVMLMTEGLGPKSFHGKIVVLVNEHTTGAAEMIAQFAKENRLATIVGTKTPGHLVAREAFKIGSGYKLTLPIAAYVSWAGDQIEGIGIEPDISINWSYDDGARGIDNQIEKGIKIARSL